MFGKARYYVASVQRKFEAACRADEMNLGLVLLRHWSAHDFEEAAILKR
jgi:hypothetical protein